MTFVMKKYAHKSSFLFSILKILIPHLEGFFKDFSIPARDFFFKRLHCFPMPHFNLKNTKKARRLTSFTVQ
jgi:hypothetical protein